MNQDGLEAHHVGATQVQPRSAADVESLVFRASKNEERAWAELVGLYSRRVYALARSRLRDQHLAEEITQAVFVAVFQYLRSGKYESSGRFEPWLFRIAMNRIRDHIRRTSRRPTHTRETSSLTAEDRPADGVADGFERLREAVMGLPDSDQEIISLRHQAGLEFKAIAEMLDEPVGTLLARHHRALAKLRKALRPEPVHENTA